MKIIHLKEIDSTNNYLKKEYKNLKDFTFVYASKQTNGKGRLNHIWYSQENKNLLCSLLIKDKCIFKHKDSFTIFIGTIIYKLLNNLGVENVSIKWPNDIYVNDKKIAGILVESIYINENIEALIVGVGINLNQRKFDTTINATSFILERGYSININDVKKKLIHLYKIELFKLKFGISNYIKTINKHNYLFNKKVLIDKNGNKVTAIISNINNDGTINALINNKIERLDLSEITLINK